MNDPDPSEKPATFEGGQDIRDRVFEFACHVLKFCEAVHDSGGVGRMLVPQLVNCSTSSATMLEEARAAESRPDFISKCSISLKELRESWTRLRMYEACRLGPHQAAADLVRECNELIAIVTSIIRNTKRNANPAGRGGQRGRTNSKFLIPNSKF